LISPQVNGAAAFAATIACELITWATGYARCSQEVTSPKSSAEGM